MQDRSQKAFALLTSGTNRGARARRRFALKMNVVVIEDQVMVRGLIARVCQERFSCERLAEAADGRTGVALCQQLQPELVLLDLDLPDGDGLDRMPEIRRVAPHARIVVITSHSDEFSIHRSLEAGVAGFVDKCAHPIEAVSEAIRAVESGRRFFSPVVGRARAQLRDDPKAFTKLLSAREQEVLRLLGEGLSNDEVAAHVGVSPQTVHSYRRNIMSKLGIHSTPHLIRYAVQKGFTRLRVPAA